MKNCLSALACFTLLMLPSCTIRPGELPLGANDYVLASHTDAAGSTESYELSVRSSTGDASLRVVSDYERQRPFLGLQLLDLDAESATHRGVQAFSGLLVKGVYPKSSAAEAGVLAGDVLLSLDGTPTVYLAPFADLELSLSAGQVVTAKVLRGQSELDLELETRQLRERVHDRQDIELESAPVPQPPYAGVVLRGIPAVWCEKIFGRPRNAVVVTGVVVGSPAWLAGVRGGDLVDEVDGAPVPPVAELLRRIGEQGTAGAAMQWRLRRGTDLAHDATIALADYSGETVVWIPLVFGLVDGVYADRWSVGPFGLLLSNRNHYVADSSSRTARTRNVFNALFGLFHVESSPDATEVRLLWIIRFAT
jgi:hypothetical protein